MTRAIRLLSLIFALTALAVPAAANNLARNRDPVVLTGTDVPSLIGVQPTRIVAFRFDGTWQQIPVQVDERAIVDFGTIYNTTPTGYTVFTYTDTATFTGPDPDPLLDAGDELAFMAQEAGDLVAGGGEPYHVIPGSGVELTVTDPLSGNLGYVYLFESDGSLDPGAGATAITYTFNLLSGDYKTTYGTMSGPNPEDSYLVTPAYAVHFSDRWIRDETAVTKDGATGVDILDRHRNLFAPGNCGRSEDTFSAGEGAFIVNRSGPVRALRGYVGANSGPTTHRIHAFYEEREDILTALRVHAISGIIDLFDYSPQAVGMVYRNDLNPTGVTIDGAPDFILPGTMIWEMVSGLQGTLAVTHLLTTDIPGLAPTSYYLDDVAPPENQCTGDDWEYGASGPWFDQFIPNTDPGVNPVYYIFEGRRIVAYGPPVQGTDFAEQASAEALAPLTVTARQYNPLTSVAEGTGDDADADSDLLTGLAFRPNPATGPVSVSFALRQPGPLAVKIYDISGRLVHTVCNRSWGAGPHTIAGNLSKLPSGVYFARAEGPGRAVRTSRLVILK